ncbi:MAG: class I SAM-dependent methyltransferase [bacterium]|nr:class I SAM-dependent methyltransferase [bacterium]
MRKQEWYRQEYRRIRPEWRDSLSIYRDVIDEATNSDTRILDVGCGHGELLKPVYDKTLHTYGVDPDKEALDKNTLIKNTVVGTVEDLPFEGNFFDLVVSEWVLEHLPDPEKAFREIYRVLKPGGRVIFLTPNVWNYNVWIIRAIPNRFHDFFTKKLYERQEGDTYPVQYKINSVKRIAKTLEPIGFKKSQMILNGDPSYISFNRPLFALACLLEKVLDLEPLNFAKVHLIGVYEK